MLFPPLLTNVLSISENKMKEEGKTALQKKKRGAHSAPLFFAILL
ncbi:hypothetical protein SD78_0162 [Bacillus badius]|nr:hypothetical protein SD78_0162 [Bacillus badius]